MVGARNGNTNVSTQFPWQQVTQTIQS